MYDGNSKVGFQEDPIQFVSSSSELGNNIARTLKRGKDM